MVTFQSMCVLVLFFILVAQIQASRVKQASPKIIIQGDPQVKADEEMKSKEEYTGISLRRVKDEGRVDVSNETELNAAFAKAYILALENGETVNLWGKVPVTEEYKKDRPLIVPRVKALKDKFIGFAEAADTSLTAVEKLFVQVNDVLWSMSPQKEEAESVRPKAKSNEISVILGGKPAAPGKDPVSLAETMVAMLVEAGAPHVLTASRRMVKDFKDGEFVTHLAGSDLFNGTDAYVKVIDKAYQLWKDTSKKADVVFYFTLGQHGAVNKAKANLAAAEYFAKALDATPAGCMQEEDRLKWLSVISIIVTGTAATNPSTTEGVTVDKIGPENFYYAMSKLAQYHVLSLKMLAIQRHLGLHMAQRMLAASTIKLLSMEMDEMREGMQADIKWMSAKIAEIGDGLESIQMSKEAFDEHHKTLDVIAVKQDRMHEIPEFRVVKGLSITFSSLHSPVYVQQAADAQVPTVSVFSNIVDRLKNAISLKDAAFLHLTALHKMH